MPAELVPKVPPVSVGGVVKKICATLAAVACPSFGPEKFRTARSGRAASDVKVRVDAKPALAVRLTAESPAARVRLPAVSAVALAAPVALMLYEAPFKVTSPERTMLAVELLARKRDPPFLIKAEPWK